MENEVKYKKIMWNNQEKIFPIFSYFLLHSEELLSTPFFSQILKIYGGTKRSLGASSRICAQATVQQAHNPVWISSRC